jgi:hypothetical protein
MTLCVTHCESLRVHPRHKLALPKMPSVHRSHFECGHRDVCVSVLCPSGLRSVDSAVSCILVSEQAFLNMDVCLFVE